MKKNNVIGLIILSFIVGAFPVTFLAGTASCAALCDCRKEEEMQCSHYSCSNVLVGKILKIS